ARNCPFLMFTTRPVAAAATSKSVCLDRNAGICRISATAATGSACDGSWMSVRIGTPALSRTRASTRSPSRRPGPRKDPAEVRLEFRVELHRHVPRMRRQFDDLDKLAVARSSNNLQALIGQRLLVEAVEFVAVPMTFIDHGSAVQRMGPRARFQFALVSSQTH